MKKTYQTYHAEHGSKHGESRIGDVGFISHGQEDHTAIKLPLEPTYLEKNDLWKKIRLDSMVQNNLLGMDLFGCWKDNQLSELISLN